MSLLSQRLRRSALLLLAALLFVPLAAAQSSTQPAVPEIPFETFELDNGLTVIVHEDHKAPIAAVNVWYHVGSKNEPDGRSGFAHLFEHLMFNGTEHYDDDYFRPFEQAGATDMNGTTNRDRTNYFENVPTNALDMALWMESDRMGHLLGAISKEKLEEQRGVVQNEKRQGENRPYGQVRNRINANTYPEGHPYDHTVIGSMEDLNAAELEDVKEWFKTYYGPNNAVLSIAGDVELEQVRKKVKKYFGDIESSPPIAKQQVNIAKMEGETREVLQDRVPQARIYKVWNVPEWGSEAETHLDLAAEVLAADKNSRLYERLVYEEEIATDVSAYVDGGEIGSQFQVQVTAQPSVSLDTVEAVLDEEMQRFLEDGPTESELERVQTERLAGFTRGIERIGGFGGKSDILAKNAVYAGDPAHYKTTLRWMHTAAPQNVHDAAKKWLSDGVFVLEVQPTPEYTAAKEGADRSELPAVGDAPEADFPELQRATLSNGLEVVLAERHDVPLVQMDLMVDAGYAADQMARPGTASLAMSALDEGAGDMGALQISDRLDRLGAELSTSANLDVSEVSLSALSRNLEPSLDLFAKVVLNPTFPEQDVARLKRERLASIKQEKNQPITMALRVFPKLIYGENHAYSLPFTGSGYERTVKQITRDDLAEYHRTWFKPNNATLVVAGDVSMQDLKPKLESAFSSWTEGDVPEKNIANVNHRDEPAVYLIDRRGAQQSVIFAGHVMPPKGNERELAVQAMNTVLGGSFTSRMNMNLREDKGWAYGARTLIPDAAGQRPFVAYAPVQTDKTKASMQEMLKELRGISGDDPPTDAELAKAKKNQTLTLPGRWETIGSVANSVGEIVRFGLPDNYYQTYAGNVRALSKPDVTLAADELVRPNNLVWVVVGDLDKIEDGVRSLNTSDVQVINADGEPVE